jgi:copper chaperone CopZ
VVVFHSLTKEHIREIVDLMLAQVSKQLEEKEIKLEVTDAAKDLLGEKGYDEVFGARPLRRVIQDMVEDKLSEAVLRGEFKVFDRVYEIKAEMTEITPAVFDAEMPEILSAVIDAIKAIKGVLSVKSSGDSLTIFSTKSLKFEVEKIIKDQIKEVIEGKPEGRTKDKDILEPRVSENSYISYVVVDMRDSEIVIESKDNFMLPNLAAVGALVGEDKA